jgi:precorrin-6B methylase 2
MSAPVEGIESQRAVLAVPPGLEVPCVRIARRETGVRFDRIAPGLIQSKERACDLRVAALLADAPIWTFGSFRLVAKLPALDARGMDAACAALAPLVEAAGWWGQSYWLTAPNGDEQRWANGFLKRDFGLLNDPGNYSLTLRVAVGDKGDYVLMGRSISVKDRFAYRKRDVGASINPVLAACLVRLLPQDLSEAAIDPTCGSGTLLFERLRFSDETAGVGIDRSTVAQEAFETNLPHVDLPGRDIGFRLGDACDSALWQPCSSVICNLPFGIRVREKTDDLDALYLGVLKTALQHLAPDGRVLMTSSYKRGLDQAAEGMAQHLKLLSRYRAEMGGLFYQVVVFARI